MSVKWNSPETPDLVFTNALKMKWRDGVFDVELMPGVQATDAAKALMNACAEIVGKPRPFPEVK